MKTKTPDIDLIEILNQYRKEFTQMDIFDPKKETERQYLQRREDYVSKKYFDEMEAWNDKK